MGSVKNAGVHDADVVVIGSGIAGLTAGALLANSGKRVVVCEQASAPGGYAHAFSRGEHGEYTFDPAVHLIADQAMFERFLDMLGVGEECTFLPSEHFYRAVLPGFSLDLPADREGFVEAHAEAFPHQAGQLRAFWSLCHTVHRQAHDLPPRMHLRDLDSAASGAPELFRYRKSTLAEVLDEYLDDERAKAVTGVCWQYLGVPPSRASFQTFAQLVTVHTDSLFAVAGGVQRLIDAIVLAIERHGGEVRLSQSVEEILVEDGRALGVRLAGGEELRADVVLSNADPFQTFERLVAPEHVPASYLRKIRRLRPSGSAFLLFAATTLDLSGFDLPHQVFTHRHWDHEQNYRDTQTGNFGVRWITPTTLLDPTVAPAGEHAVVCKAITPYDIGTPWREVKEGCTQLLLDELDELFPGFTAGLTFAESATPLTIERFSRNTGGAIHSWEQIPAQTEGRRPPAVTPIDGLYLCSQWTSIGGSFLRAFVSGTIVAQMVTEAEGTADAIPDLRSDAVPQSPSPKEASMATTSSTKVTTESTTEDATADVVAANVAVVRRVLKEVWNDGNLAVADELIHVDAFDNDKQPGEADGVESFKEHVALLRGASSDMRLDVEQVWGAGDRVVARWRWRGVNDRPLFDLPPTGKRFDITTVAIYRLQDGKVAEIWKATDLMQMMEQLEVLPPRDAGPVHRLSHTVATLARMGRSKVRWERSQRGASA